MLRPRAGWCVYILRCRDGSPYTGSTHALGPGLERHGTGKGARYTRSRLPVDLVHGEHRTEALRREAAVKRLSRAGKLALVAAIAAAPPGDAGRTRAGPARSVAGRPPRSRLGLGLGGS